MPKFSGTADQARSSQQSRNRSKQEQARASRADLEIDDDPASSKNLDEPDSQLNKSGSEEYDVVDREPKTKWQAFLAFVRADERPVRWIKDRCNGHERVMNPDVKPCCCLMFPNGFLKLMPGLLESNCFMEWFGQIGFIKHDWYRIRRAIHGISMIFATVGWTCMLFVCLSISKDYDILQKFDFSHADVRYRFSWGEDPDPTLNGFTGGNFTINVGLTAVAWQKTYFNFTELQFNDAIDSGAFGDGEITLEDVLNWVTGRDDLTYKEETVTSFNAFCDGGLNRIWFVDDCDACRKISNKLVRNILMSTIFYFFTFKNDWLRFWPNYDVNCQKFMSVSVGSITVALAMNVFFQYRGECLNSFREGTHCFFLNGTETECPAIHTDPSGSWADNMTDAEVDAEFDKFFAIAYNDIDWHPGAAMILLGTAVFIRLYSMLSNLTVPTPAITRDRNMQWEYERIAEEQDAKEGDFRKSEYFAPW